jgi:acetate kinase
MVTLVINPGSSSKKYALYKQGVKIFSMVFEKTSKDIGRCTQIGSERVHCSVATSHSYKAALHEMLTEAKRVQAIASVADITTVAFRIVAPGRMFMEHHCP